mgnify:CR=1 FL=1
MARDLAWDWIGDAHDRFAVGNQILVRVTKVDKTSQEELSVHANVKSVTENTSREALKRCRVQSKYAGRITDVHKALFMCGFPTGSTLWPTPATTAAHPAKRMTSALW